MERFLGARYLLVLVMVMDYKHICKVSALMHVTRYQHFSA